MPQHTVATPSQGKRENAHMAARGSSSDMLTRVVPPPTRTPNHHDGEHAMRHLTGPRRLQAL
eukprot:7498058-Pyramimonas_sp.AAC.1